MGHDTGEALLATHPEFLTYSPLLTKIFGTMVHTQDLAEVRQLLAQALDGPVGFGDVASKQTTIGVMSTKEAYTRLDPVFDRIDLADCRSAVMVGCGARPFTMFRMHDETEAAEIIGLDIVPEAMDSANILAARLGYDRMRAELCDGRAYDYAKARFIYVASMVTPKAAVVSRIADTAPDDVQIVIWEPWSLGRLWAESVEETIDPRLVVTDRTDVYRNMTRDIFVRRRGHQSPTRRPG